MTRRLATLLGALLIEACAPSAIPRSHRMPTIEDPPADLRGSDPDGDGCGPELLGGAYKVQCAEGAFAMVCSKEDPTQRRCTCLRGGRYFWTYGYLCNVRLACYAQPCR